MPQIAALMIFWNLYQTKRGGINAEWLCIKVTNNDKLIQVDMDRIVESEV